MLRSLKALTLPVTVQADGGVVIGGNYEPLVLKELHRTEETALESDASVRPTLVPAGRTANCAKQPFPRA